MSFGWEPSYALRKLTKDLKEFDSKLYAKKSFGGHTFIMRKHERMIPYHLDAESYLMYPIQDDFMIFPLTDNWMLNGNPVPWSSMNIINRLREIDSWNRDVVKEVHEHNEKVDASKERDFKNNAEAFFSDNYKAFQRQFSDVNTSNIDKKTSDKRYKYDKRTKN